MELIIVIIIIAIILLSLLIISKLVPKNELKGGYYHKIIMDETSLKTLNNLLIALREKPITMNDLDFSNTAFVPTFYDDKIVLSIYYDDVVRRPFNGENGYQINNGTLGHPITNHIVLRNLEPSALNKQYLKRSAILQMCYEYNESLLDPSDPHQTAINLDKMINFINIANAKKYKKLTDLMHLFINSFLEPSEQHYEIHDDPAINDEVILDDFSYDNYKDIPMADNLSISSILAMLQFANRVISPLSFSVTYPDMKERTDVSHSVYLYRGIRYNRENSISTINNGTQMIPFLTLMNGWDICSFVNGVSGFGMYTTPRLDLAYSYGSVIYKFEMKYKKYWPTLVQIDISDKALEIITNNFDPQYIKYPSKDIINIWLLTRYHTGYLDDVKYYFKAITNNKIGPISIDEYVHNEISMIQDNLFKRIPELKTIFKPNMKLITTIIKPQRTSNGEIDYESGFRFMESRGIDLIVSYTHGSSLQEYSDMPIWLALAMHAETDEVVVRHGYGLVLKEVLYMTKP